MKTPKYSLPAIFNTISLILAICFILIFVNAINFMQPKYSLQESFENIQIYQRNIIITDKKEELASGRADPFRNNYYFCYSLNKKMLIYSGYNKNDTGNIYNYYNIGDKITAYTVDGKYYETTIEKTISEYKLRVKNTKEKLFFIFGLMLLTLSLSVVIKKID